MGSMTKRTLTDYLPRTDLPILHHVPQEGTWLGYVWAVSSDDGTELFRGAYKTGNLDRDGFGDCQRWASANFGGYRCRANWTPAR